MLIILSDGSYKCNIGLSAIKDDKPTRLKTKAKCIIVFQFEFSIPLSLPTQVTHHNLSKVSACEDTGRGRGQ